MSYANAPPPLRDRSKVGTAVGVAGGCLVMAVGLVAVLLAMGWAVVPDEEPAIPRAEESNDQVDRETARAFRGGPLRGERELEPVVEAMFDSLGAAYASGQETRIIDHFDLDRAFAYVPESSDFSDPEYARDLVGSEPMHQAVIYGIGWGPADLAWRRTEIRAIQPGDRAGELVVLSRHWFADGSSLKLRWWLIENESGLKAFDVEDMATGMRLADYLEHAFSATAWEATDDVVLPRLVAANHASVTGDFQTLSSELEALNESYLSDPADALRWFLWAWLEFTTDDLETALESLDEAEALNPRMRISLRLRAAILNQRGDHQAAIDQIKIYEKRLGPDCRSYRELGAALVGLNRRDEAIAAFRRGLADSPDDLDNLIGLALALPPERLAELDGWLAEHPLTPERFEQLAQSLYRQQAAGALATVVEAQRRSDPNMPALPFYDAWTRTARGEHDAAAERILSALTWADEDWKEPLIQLCCDALASAGKPLEAYERLPDKRVAFQRLAERFEDRQELERLGALIVAHQREHPADPWLEYHRGEMFFAQQDFDAAATAHAKARELSRDDETRESMRTSQVYSLFHAGRSVEAYTQVPPIDDTLDQLIGLCRFFEQAEPLKQLIEAHKATHPYDPRLVTMGAIHGWLAKDYAGLSMYLSQYRSALEADDSLGAETYADWRIRSLVRLGRTNEAMQIMGEVLLPHDLTFYQSIVYAAEGNPSRTLDSIRACLIQGWEPADFYDDEDIGPALRSEAFREVRAAVPEPPPEDEPGSQD